MLTETLYARLVARYYEAADTVFMDGSTPWEVDEAMVDFGFEMGPFEAQDLAGLDQVRSTAPLAPGRRHIPLVSRMYELGKLGKKTGAGWYRYPGGNGKVEDPIVADLALEESHFAGRARTDYAPWQIQERLVLALINAAAEVLDDGGAMDEIDAACVSRLGFPEAKGGPLRYADKLGVMVILRRLDALSAEDPMAWKASPALRRGIGDDKTAASLT